MLASASVGKIQACDTIGPPAYLRGFTGERGIPTATAIGMLLAI
jgi:hypothetical protein